MDNYKHLVKKNVLDEETFIKTTFSGRQRGQVIPWHKVVVRPVLIKERRHLQFSYFDAKKDITKNYTDAEIGKKLDELLALPFKSINVQTTNQTFQVQITKKGKVILHQHKVPGQQKTPSLQHDHQKDLLLPADTPDPFLQQIGIMTQDGKVRAKMQKKFRQINEFLKLIVETGALEKIEQSPLDIIDCGCGNAYLTFAVYHYLSHRLELPTRMIGIDVNQSLLNRRLALSRDLGWDDLTFQATRIADYQPNVSPGMVLALHACDTATDEALAQAVKWQSQMIFCAPCCHHHLQQQLSQQIAPSPFKPVLRHAVFKERLGDMLTDTFRSLLLQIMGYRTEVVEFVSTEHTGKNLMIRAIKSSQPGNRQAIREYKQLAGLWQVKPYLGQLLEKELLDLGF